MHKQKQQHNSDPAQLRLFMKGLLTDLRALERMLREDRIETGVRRIGAEQELALIDGHARPAPRAMDILGTNHWHSLTTELARFNLEINLDPILFGGDCLTRLEHSMNEEVAAVARAAEPFGVRVLLTGILPTLRSTDLGLDNMTPMPRYFALNNALSRHRGGEFELRFAGTDELIIRHDSVMLEACNTSAQFHFQVAPHEFARFYNVAQAVAGFVLAAATNSPLLFGRRLWRETRIALFQQAVDSRSSGHQLEERRARVWFGSGWVTESVIEVFREDIARFRVLLGIDVDEDAMEVVQAGDAPELKALRLHNGTVYRWMRPCYGVAGNVAHLRIENRLLPSGPTVADEVANAALWFGLISGVAARYDDVTEVMKFDSARLNFVEAARSGLHTQLRWLDGNTMPAQRLICDKLLPLAEEGLRLSGIDDQDIARYLGIIDKRVERGRTGSEWLLEAYDTLRGRGDKSDQLAAVTEAAWARQCEGAPVHEWSPITASERRNWHSHYGRIDQIMTTDVFTVHQNEVIDLVASLMDWEHIRHVPVEDDEGFIVGLISYRRLLRFLSSDLPHGKNNPVSAREIMHPEPITITPETTTLEAIDIMRQQQVPCLPVVIGRRVVGIVSDRDFMHVAAELLEEQLRRDTPGEPQQGSS